MTDSQTEQYTDWIDHTVVDQAGDKVGKVTQIYVDDETGELSWVAINTGLFARRSSFVPVAGARADGDQMVIAWNKAKVKDAPQVDDDGDGYVSPEEEEELYSYYGRQLQPRESDGRDTSGPTTDDAMTRSEERVNVGTRTAETGRARLRKYVVTEQVTQTVPISHEEVRIEREPITDANRDSATAGPEISEEVHEVTLHEEVPVVEKEVVPVERVRLSTDTVTGEETINEEVRREEIKEEGANRGRDSDR
jgi:uncharacterized protein (TIGR02271 family)